MPGLGAELLRCLAGTQVVPRLVSERPQEWRLGALTVVVGRDRARLRYAREMVATAAPRAGEIAGAWRRALERLQARSLAPDDLWPKLTAAYAKIRGSRDRVPLVEVRAALPGYTRAQFAWDLARLRRERRLAVGDRRIDLGIATGHATARKSRVVWIEDDAGGGAFYESFRLITQEAP
jgi:hypothetical protein